MPTHPPPFGVTHYVPVQDMPLPPPITALDEEELLTQLKASQTLIPAKLAKGSGNNLLNIQQRSSDSGSSPGLGTSTKTTAKQLSFRVEGNSFRRRRQQRLSTISSELIDQDNGGEYSPRASMRQRRRSSNFDMLYDPFKYQDYVNKFLDGIEEEQDQ